MQGLPALLSSGAHGEMWPQSRYNKATDSASSELNHHALVMNTESRAGLPGLLKTQKLLAQMPAQLPKPFQSCSTLDTGVAEAATHNSHAVGRLRAGGRGQPGSVLGQLSQQPRGCPGPAVSSPSTGACEGPSPLSPALIDDAGGAICAQPAVYNSCRPQSPSPCPDNSCSA